MTRGALERRRCPTTARASHQALHSYTADGAYAGFMEGKTGVLKEGMLADMSVLPGTSKRPTRTRSEASARG